MSVDAIKIALLVLLWLTLPPAVALLAASRPYARRLLIAVLVFSFALHPLMSLSYEAWSRYNVRGWEFGWAELIAVGLIMARMREGAPWARWLSPLIALWCVHLACLAVSAIHGIDPLTSAWYWWRMFRGLLIMLAIALTLRDRDDYEAVICGMMLTCLWNEWTVLRQKYGAGRYQTPGVFDHQNAMGMYMILCAMVMLAAWLFRAVRPGLRYPLFVAILCSGHSVFSGLSRGSMVMYGLALAATGLTSLAVEPDRHKLRAVVLLAVVGGTCTAFMVPTIIARFHDRGNDISEQTRTVMNEVALQMYVDRPAFGVGPNNYAEAVNLQRYAHDADLLDLRRGYLVRADAHRGQVESLYWGLIAEGGVLGLGSVLAYMAATLVALAVKLVGARDKLARAFAIGAFWALFANYVQCQLEHTLLHAQNLYLWAALVGGCIALPWRRPLPGRTTPDEVAAAPAAARAARPAAAAGAGAFWA